jgi:hypothetical protein
MRVLQRVDPRRKNIVLIENPLHRTRLFAGKLSIDIGDEEFVAEFSPGQPLSPAG